MLAIVVINEEERSERLARAKAVLGSCTLRHVPAGDLKPSSQLQHAALSFRDTPARGEPSLQVVDGTVSSHALAIFINSYCHSLFPFRPCHSDPCQCSWFLRGFRCCCSVAWGTLCLPLLLGIGHSMTYRGDLEQRPSSSFLFLNKLRLNRVWGRWCQQSLKVRAHSAGSLREESEQRQPLIIPERDFSVQPQQIFGTG